MRTVFLAGLIMLLPVSARSETVRLYAAGSLRVALTEIAKDFEAQSGGQHKVETTFGASGLLRERIEAGEPANVFASADTGHPKKLFDLGRTATPVAVFARNELCALVRSGLAVSPETLLDVMLDPKVRVGISTPKADPSGDYAFALFTKADATKPGVKVLLETKALQLVGNPNSAKAPEGRTVYGWLMANDKADVFLTYCTNALLAKSELASLSIVAIPKALSVGADYGLVVLKGAPPSTNDLVDYIRSAKGESCARQTRIWCWRLMLACRAGWAFGFVKFWVKALSTIGYAIV